jgi:hypothetical protein
VQWSVRLEWRKRSLLEVNSLLVILGRLADRWSDSGFAGLLQFSWLGVLFKVGVSDWSVDAGVVMFEVAVFFVMMPMRRCWCFAERCCAII